MKIFFTSIIILLTLVLIGIQVNAQPGGGGDPGGGPPPPPPDPDAGCTIFTVGGGGTTCNGTTGVSITLSSSEIGVTYQLTLNGSNVGSTVAGTGNVLTWTNISTPGTYNITNTTCPIAMTGSAVISVNPPAQTFTVGGGGSFCAGGLGISVTLSGSETGVSYQLKLGSSDIGSLVLGTGSAINFGNQTSAGTYTVIAASGTACSQAMTGNSVVTVNPLPTTYALSGGGTFCSGSAGPTIMVSSSQTGVNYQLMQGSTLMGTMVAGTGAALNWTNNTIAGAYTIVGTNSATGCNSTMNGTVTVTPNASLTTYSVSGGGSICSGGSGLTVAINGSQTGINYQLKMGTTNVGTAIAGTGSTLSWANNVTAGTYTILATDATTSCTATMSGSAIITVNTSALPTAYTVSGGGSYCSGSSGPTIRLSNSQSGVNYQLMQGSNPVGVAIAGTAAALSWTNNTGSGTYSVVATNATTGCSSNMNGSASVSVIPVPNLFAVSGGGNLCSGFSGLTIALSSSETGINYQLKRGTTNVGSALAGTGISLSWSNNTTAGTYTIVATNTSTNCTSTMTGSAVITIIPLPALHAVTGGSSCTGAITVGINGSQSGVNYQLKVSGSPIGASIAGTGSALSFGSQSTLGSYTVIATDATWGCTSAMTGSAVLKLAPALFSVSGGGPICPGSIGGTINLSGSENGVNYQLKKGATNIGSAVGGTGSALNWSSGITAAGTYTVVATNATTSCNATMTGSAIVTVNVLPTLYNVTGGSSCNAGIAVGLSKSQSGVTYQLTFNGINSGSPKNGTGAALAWGVQSAVGSYAVIATNSSTGCSVAMTGLASINNLPSQFSVSGGGAYCPGGSGVGITLSNSDPGVNYQLQIGGINVSSLVAGTGNPLTWNGLTTAGSYTVMATNVATGCSQLMSGNASVSINPLPTVFNVGGGGSVCNVGGPPSITLDGSQIGVNYQLLLNGSSTQPVIAGNGTEVSWKSQLTGSYSVTGINVATGCTGPMNGNVSVSSDATCTMMSNLSFQYRYDGRKRMTQKKVPGADWVYMVYDDRDRLVLTQDGNQRASKQWTFTKYDALNRPIMTGIYTHDSPATQAEMSGLISATNFFDTYDGTATFHGYTNTVFPISNTEVLSVTYYDNYSLIFDQVKLEMFMYTSNDLPDLYNYNGTGQSFPYVIGQVTGAKTKVMDQNAYLWSVKYYDDKYRLVQTIESDPKSALLNSNSALKTNRTSIVYDFVGKVLKTKGVHNATSQGGNGDHRLIRSFEYDHAGRLMKTYHSLDGAPQVLLSANEYNEIGQLVTKKLYSTDPASTPDDQMQFKQAVDYRYNIRGWLTRINDSDVSSATNNTENGSNVLPDLFGMNLLYDQADTGLGNNSMYNGNISAVKWSNNLGLGTIKNLAYKYGYDTLNRIKSSTYMTNPGIWTASSNFAEGGFSYDLNGNIKKLSRTNASGGSMDVLSYDYVGQGNQLRSVTDGGDILSGFVDGNIGGDDYTYDVNGNMTSDKNKNITTIAYNYLNLPQQVTKGTGEKIIYTYDASGRKLKQQVFNTSGTLTKTTAYVGEYIYQNDTLQFINHEEGRVVMKPLSPGEAGVRPEYQYHLKDHLGNVRLTFTTNAVVESPVATFESANYNSEQNKFLRMDDARTINSRLFDHTYDNQTLPADGSAYSERLSGSDNEKTGIARSISVMPGDVIEMEVFAKYIDPSGDNDPALIAFINSIILGTASAGTVIDGSKYSTNGQMPFPYGGLAGEGGEQGDGPKAYLNYIMFDRNHVPIIDDVSQTNFVRVSTDALEDGKTTTADGKTHERLYAKVIAKQAGYMYIYLSNENPTPVEVYFDDFKVTQNNSPLVQQEDFYPFGLSFNSYSRENTVPQNFLYNSKEQINDLNVGWYDFGRRMHQPEIGRFFSQDRFTEKYYGLNPYHYGANNPIIFNDINGDSLWINFGQNRALYNNGQLQNADGSRYEGEGVKVTKKGNIRITNSFLRGTVNALKTMGSANAGSNLIAELQSSDNNFTIKQGNFRFDPENKNEASAFQVMDEGRLVDPSKGITKYGSGGTIYFNPFVSPSINGTTYSSTIGLAHEMFHGSDSNSGELDSRNIPFNGVCCEQRQEIRATYFQNVLSQQLGGSYPLRKYYGGTEYPPMPPALLDNNNPLNTYPPSFYLKIQN